MKAIQQKYGGSKRPLRIQLPSIFCSANLSRWLSSLWLQGDCCASQDLLFVLYQKEEYTKSASCFVFFFNQDTYKYLGCPTQQNSITTQWLVLSYLATLCFKCAWRNVFLTGPCLLQTKIGILLKDKEWIFHRLVVRSTTYMLLISFLIIWLSLSCPIGEMLKVLEDLFSICSVAHLPLCIRLPMLS